VAYCFHPASNDYVLPGAKKMEKEVLILTRNFMPEFPEMIIFVLLSG
jgi:hypothetical protein